MQTHSSDLAILDFLSEAEAGQFPRSTSGEQNGLGADVAVYDLL